MQFQFHCTHFVRKLIMIIILQIIILPPIFAKACVDTSTGIYFTKEQFEKNNLQLKSCYWIKIKGPILWADFSFEARGALKIKVNKEIIKIFEPGSIYGFKKEDIKFKFIRSLNKYLAILYENSSVTLFVKENVYLLYHKAKRVTFLYSTNIDSSLRKFNKLNIQNDFSKNLNLEKKLLDLSGKIDRKKRYFRYKDFLKWQKKIEVYLK